ncbi:type IV pilin protein [Pseudorhodoferax sp. Leaf267]|uniref:type IV pilin protein n=1 Tax=Pseudorhodoferax sp. Leaf267 TaxID=1736316 RepID=UPI0006FDCD96|nr:type IV pilin protein [Pseudorhodoferax sp. Leaf267]KQP13284.1 fimbrial protein [Pseudorhodoferax sp. Leaf267]
MNRMAKGFTLIEVMIVVAVIGILSAIALPQYNEYVRRGHRSDARALLLQGAQWMERAATATGRYPLQADFPTTLKTMPSGRYSITVASTDGATFLLTATPAGAQAADKCGKLTLTHTGLRGVEGASASESATSCWTR